MRQEWYKREGDNAIEQLFLSDLEQLMAKHIINNLEYHPDLTYHVMPYRDVILQLEMSQVIDIKFHHDSTSKFYIGNYGPLSLDGVISYANEVWIPEQRRSLTRAEGRKDLAKELDNELSNLSVKYDITNVPYIVKQTASVSIRSSRLKYYAIANNSATRVISEHPNSSTWQLMNMGINDALMIVVLLREDLNMVKVSYIYPPPTNNKYRNWYQRGHSGWFSPKNIMFFLTEQVKKHPDLQALLANPDMVKNADPTQE